MYRQHFNLKKKPFQISSDNELLWLGEKHATTLTALKKGLADDEHCMLALIGDIGTGKTTLINEIIHTLDEETLFVKIENPCFEVHQLLLFIARAFGFDNRYKEEKEFSSAFHSFLQSAAERNKKVLIIVDEAQGIPEQFLKKIVSWSEFDLNPVLTVILAGQLELLKILGTKPGQVQPDGKIVQIFLKPLNENETRIYIRKRLEMAGTDRKIFLISAIHEAYIYSKGVPRLINISCDQALMAAFAKNMKIVDVPTFKQVLHELALPTFHEPAPPTGHEHAPSIGIVEKALPKKQPEKKPSADNRQRDPKKERSTGLAIACCICLGIAFLFYTGYLPSVIKNMLPHYQGNMSSPINKSKKAGAQEQAVLPRAGTAVTPAFPEKIIVNIPKPAHSTEHNIGLGYTPSSSGTAQLPAMADKIPANILKAEHPAGLNIGLGYTPDHPYPVGSVPPSAPIKNIKKKHRLLRIRPVKPENMDPRDLEVFIKEIFLLRYQANLNTKILARGKTTGQISHNKASESVKFDPGKNKTQALENPAPRENPAPGAIIDWLIKKSHLHPRG